MKRRHTLPPALAAAVLAAGAGPAAAAFDCGDGGIVLGLVKAETGPFAFFDKAGAQGALVAIDEINAAGGIDGCPIEVVRGDTKSDPALARQVAEDLVGQGAELLIVPADFDIGVGASQVAQEAGLLSLSPEASSTSWPLAVGPNHFVSAITIEDLGRAEAAFAGQKGWNRVYMVTNEAFDYFTSQARVFEEAYGGEIVGRDVVADDASDYAPQVSKIRAAADQIDAVFLNDYFPHVGTFIRQLRAAGVDVPVLGNQTYSSAALPEVVGADALRDVYYIAQGFYEGEGVAPEVAALVSAYEDRFGAFPENGNVLAGYQGILLLADALRTAGSTDATAVSAALSAQQDVELPASTVYRWVDRAPARSAAVIGFDDQGRFVEVQRIDPGAGAE